MDWKENIELFLNKQFKFAIKEEGKISFKNLEVEMYFPDTGRFGFYGIDNCVSVDKCVLMARPVNDMTKPELQKVFNNHPFDVIKWDPSGHFTFHTSDKRVYYYHLDLKDLTFTLVKNMLDIRVYPFNQNDFKTGKVISINE